MYGTNASWNQLDCHCIVLPKLDWVEPGVVISDGGWLISVQRRVTRLVMYNITYEHLLYVLCMTRRTKTVALSTGCMFASPDVVSSNIVHFIPWHSNWYPHHIGVHGNNSRTPHIIRKSYSFLRSTLCSEVLTYTAGRTEATCNKRNGLNFDTTASRRWMCLCWAATSQQFKKDGAVEHRNDLLQWRRLYVKDNKQYSK